jgi:hypothetical protein
MSEELEALRAEVAALRAEVAAGTPSEQTAISRRRLLTGLAGVGAAGVAAVATANPASADDGDSLTLGVTNSSTSPTVLSHTSTDMETALQVKTSSTSAIFATTDPEQEPFDSNIKRAILAIAGGEVGPNGAAFGIGAFAIDGIAVEGVNDSDGRPAVVGTNQGAGAALAGVSFGHGPQLVLSRESSPSTGPPSGTVEAGSIRFDGAGDLWLCLADGSPGSWTRLLREDTAAGRVIPIAPMRVLDTRATGGRAAGAPVVPGQRKGPLRGGSSVTLDLAGVAPIPATASGVVGNATVLTSDGNGFLRIMPAGASVPAATFNFYDGVTVSNGFTSGLTSAGLRAVAPAPSTVRYHLVIDISAYIT